MGGVCCCVHQNASESAQHVETLAVLPKALSKADESWSVSETPSGYASKAAARCSSLKCEFPTLCMPMMQFLELERMQPHEAVFKDLIEPGEGLIMHFISHEWLGFKHPDPDGMQLQRMQQIFRIIMEGNAQTLFHEQDWGAFLKGVSATSSQAVHHIESSLSLQDQLTGEDLIEHVVKGGVWLDYHSIPQGVKDESFIKAVKGIPCFVERCDYFWVCAPSTLHTDLHEPRDFASWRRRGWCRLEENINFLSKTLPLVITDQPKLSVIGLFDGIGFHLGRPDRSVFNGDFTCCRFNHRMKNLDGTWTDIPCDKEAIGPTLQQAFDFCIRVPTKQQALRANLLRRVATTLFSGYAPGELEWSPDPNETVEDFLATMGYRSIDDVDGMGWTPLLWALNMAHIDVLREIVRRRPSMIHTTSMHGMTVLMRSFTAETDRLKEFFAMFDPQDLQKMVNHRSNAGNFALDQACKHGFHDCAQLIIEAQADVNMRKEDTGMTPLMGAAREGYPKCCEMLINHRADLHATNLAGLTALHLAAQHQTVTGNQEPDAKLQVIQVLLEARASVDAVDKEGHTAAEVAQASFFPRAAELLSACP